MRKEGPRLVLLAVVGVLILDAYIDSAALTSIATAVKSWALSLQRSHLVSGQSV